MPIRKADTTQARFAALQLEEEAKATRRIAALTAASAARQERLLDPRARTMGVDVPGIDSQLAERQRALAEEAARVAAEEEDRVAAAAAVEALAAANVAVRAAASLDYGRALQEQAAAAAATAGRMSRSSGGDGSPSLSNGADGCRVNAAITRHNSDHYLRLDWPPCFSAADLPPTLAARGLS